MRIALSTNWNAFRHESADGMLDEIRGLGFDTVELGYSLTQTQADGVLDWTSSGRIKVSSIHAFCPASIPGKSGPELYSICDPTDYKKSRHGIAAVRATADFAAAVGAKAIVLHAGRVPIYRHIRKLADLAEAGRLGTPKHEKQLQRIMDKRNRYATPYLDTLCESLNDLLPHFEKLGITLGLENLPTYDAMPNEPEMQTLLDSFPTKALGYWHDAGHAQIRQNLGFINHAGIVSRFADNIAGLHLHDVGFPTSDHRMPPGGTVDFRLFTRFIPSDIPFVLEPARGSDTLSVTAAVGFLSELWHLDDSPHISPSANPPH